MKENDNPPKMNRRTFLRNGIIAGAAVGAGIVGAFPLIRKWSQASHENGSPAPENQGSKPQEAYTSGKPNVLVIMLDDLGYGDTSLYGNSVIDTPNIQSIADNGILFTHAYSAAPVCNPSRAAIFSSLPPGYYGADNNYSGRKAVDPLSHIHTRQCHEGQRLYQYVCGQMGSRNG